LEIVSTPASRSRLDFAYLDTETTGLNGGAGTYAFAAAIARSLPSTDLEVVQFFLPEPGGEAAFLHALVDELWASSGIATYNGRCFDLPLLRTRWIMARMAGELEHPAHLDLLDLARTLLKARVGSCALRSIEIAVLGLEREADLPSAMVPDAYFSYLRRGSSPWLEAALRHNRQDVVSLHHLHQRLVLRLDGADPDMRACDWLALGKHHLRQGRKTLGWRALRSAVELLEEDASAAAALILARRLSRRGDFRSAEALLAWLDAKLPGHQGVGLARARLLEWRLREPGRALAVVEAMLNRLPARSPEAAALENRRSRLSARVERGLQRPQRKRPQPALRDDVAESIDQVGIEGTPRLRRQALECLYE
jgi:hypothetical protein